jgi:ribose-phosphate pyrophosphokinase
MPLSWADEEAEAMKGNQPLLLFALGGDRAFGELMARRMGRALSRHEEREFEGGEHKARPLEEVGGRDVFVLHSLHGEAGRSANDKLVRMLLFIGALKDAGAARVTAIAPYLCYSRKDRRTKPRDPVTTRYVASLFEAIGTDAIVTCDVHNVSAFENAFRVCRAENVPLAGLFAEHFAARIGDEPVAVVSPDAGGDKRAELFRHRLEGRLGREVGKAVMEKHRSAGIVSGALLAGDVAGRTAIIVDDLISSGTTLVRATAACREAGAARVIAAAAHALFPRADLPLFGADGPDALLVSDTVALAPDTAVAAGAKLTIVSAAELLADIVSRLHDGQAVSDLIPYD